MSFFPIKRDLVVGRLLGPGNLDPAGRVRQSAVFGCIGRQLVDQKQKGQYEIFRDDHGRRTSKHELLQVEGLQRCPDQFFKLDILVGKVLHEVVSARKRGEASGEKLLRLRQI